MGALMYVSFIFALLLTSLRRPSAQVHAGSSPDPPLTQIPWDLYHRSHDLLDKVRGLVGRHPDKLSVETLRAGNKGYGAEVVVVTYSAFKRKTYNNTAFRILLTFGQHGRELITTEVALRLLSILSNEHASLGIDHVLLHESLKNLVIKVVPMENLNGRKLVEAGDLCDRRNGRGVDLNRNWSVDWGKKEKDFDPYEEYPGSAPFSEPEVQIMRKLSTSFNPHIWVNVHSGMEALFMPYDHKNTTPRGVTSPVMKAILEELNYNHCKGRCLIGSGGGSVGYLAHGTATDYMYEIVKVPLAFTFEIYGDVDASTKDCFKMFNPVDTIAFEKVLNDWSAAFLKMFQITPLQLGKIRKKFPMNLDGMISMDSGVVLDGSLRGRKVGTMEGFELGMQEMRTYFRLFLLSCVLLMFMFCSRISKSKFIATKTNPTT